jgi:ketosteroid isomerase-like protein
MSQENVEIVRRIYNRAPQNPEILYERLDPRVEWDTTASDFPDAGVYHGLEGVKDYRRRFWGTWEAGRNEPEEFIDAGEKVIVIARMGGRGKGSGVEVEQRFAMVWTLSGGEVTRIALYRDRNDALEAVGLSKQDAPADS